MVTGATKMTSPVGMNNSEPDAEVNSKSPNRVVDLPNWHKSQSCRPAQANGGLQADFK